MALSLALGLASVAVAEDAPGRFDYYVLSLSWSPNWCDRQGQNEKAEQCDPGRRLGFVVHGLWPQYERGWPSDCRSPLRNPSRRETAAMADIMGSAGLAWYQWKKHGSCAGLMVEDYFALLRRAAAGIKTPPELAEMRRDTTLPSPVVEAAFLRANPSLMADGVTVTCQSRALQEVRICLTKNLQPRACGADARKDCAGDLKIRAPR
ncbi:ribonuclease T2 family protein [Paracoccus sp. (in: a-proteobacteria)]|uniref:ribonuclease T2 family protein n=1 Tax=Paracoccus sp. TaxID=267 RepID=UPI0039E28532